MISRVSVLIRTKHLLMMYQSEDAGKVMIRTNYVFSSKIACLGGGGGAAAGGGGMSG